MGPLEGIKVIEIAGIGPGPFCAMVLADLGADVIRVDRAERVPASFPDRPAGDLLTRNRPNIGVDLKNPDGIELVLKMVESADAIIEGFRPGVMERLGLGPDVCLKRNPKLVYGRMTGWGQEGPMAKASGHDINYIALSGALHAIGREGEAPVPPLNLVGDFGGGGMLLALGVVAALVERGKSGQGQVVDAAMVDGAALLMAMFYGSFAAGAQIDDRGLNMLDTGTHFYNTYETKDGKYISLGSIEPQFYAELMEKTGLDKEQIPAQMDRNGWRDLKKKFAELFKTKTRDEWDAIMLGSDICYAPVLSLAEAPDHPHNKHRSTFVEVGGVKQPAPAPRFSRTPGTIHKAPSHAGQDTNTALKAWGWSDAEVAKLREAGAIK
ncbi:MAG: CoA transferase [Dehalococcoidia bacterium]|nr:CoA transferase [Dehalococcoidia bacterium]